MEMPEIEESQRFPETALFREQNSDKNLRGPKLTREIELEMMKKDGMVIPQRGYNTNPEGPQMNIVAPLGTMDFALVSLCDNTFAIGMASNILRASTGLASVVCLHFGVNCPTGPDNDPDPSYTTNYTPCGRYWLTPTKATCLTECEVGHDDVPLDIAADSLRGRSGATEILTLHFAIISREAPTPDSAPGPIRDIIRGLCSSMPNEGQRKPILKDLVAIMRF